MLVCLQPFSQYKRKDLYKYVESFELADPSFFEDVVITENLCICTLKKEYVDKYTWQDLVLRSVDQRYIEFYKWNIEHNIGLVPKQIRDEQLLPENLNIYKDKWFIESLRCSQMSSGGGFGTGSSSYKWNISDANLDIAFVFMVDLKSGLSKGNFIKYWYNGKKTESLASRVILGTKNDNFVGSSYFAIPQIDWENIHINQKELWDKGLYDEAVLSEMGLKWNADKTVIIKDE